MRYYELTCLISSELSLEEINSFQEKIISYVQEEKGILVKINECKPSSSPTEFRLRNEGGKEHKALFDFAKARVIDQPSKKKGDFTLFGLNFQLNPEKVEGLEKKLKADKQILRYFIITKKVPKAGKISGKPLRVPKKIQEPKVELKEIEKKLDEILGE